MLVENTKNDIQRSGFDTDVACTVEADSIFFDMMSNMVYARKEEAVLREYSKNAYDAHLDAGKADMPFEVHLPSRLSPEARFRDYGKGMDRETLLTTFTTYFKSTKRQNASALGGMGMGSKSGLALTSQVGVTSICDGLKFSCVLYKNEENRPHFNILAEEKTNEPSGVEIVVPVEASSIQSFMDAARKIYKYFPIRPKITGISEIPEVDYALKGNGWAIRKEYSGKANIILGVVPYPVDLSAASKLPEDLYTVFEMPVDIFLGASDCKVSMSRESLSYEKKTLETLEKVARNILEELPKEFTKLFTSCKTLWEAKGIYTESVSNRSFSYKVHRVLNNVLRWNGKDISDGGFQCPKTTDVTVYYIDKHSSSNKTLKKYPRYSVTVPATYTKVYWDNAEKGLARIKQHLAGEEAPILILEAESQSLIEEYLKTYVGEAPYVKTSDLPEPPKLVRPPRPSNKMKGIYKAGARSWEDAEHNEEDGGVYVSLRCKKSVKYNHDLFLLIRTAVGLGLVKEVFGIPATYKKIESMPGWTELGEHLTPLVQAEYPKINDEMRKRNTRRRIASTPLATLYNNCLSAERIQLAAKYPQVAAIFNLISPTPKEDTALSARETQYIEIAEILGLDWVKDSYDTKLVAFFEMVEKAVPLVGMFIKNVYYGAESKEVRNALCEYINNTIKEVKYE